MRSEPLDVERVNAFLSLSFLGLNEFPYGPSSPVLIHDIDSEDTDGIFDDDALYLWVVLGRY